MKDLKCSVHGTALVEKEVPIFYGMPTPDSNIFEIGRCWQPAKVGHFETREIRCRLEVW